FPATSRGSRCSSPLPPRRISPASRSRSTAAGRSGWPTEGLVLDAHLDENRVCGRERLAQRPIELRATADPHGFDTLSARQGTEIEMRQMRARRRREAEVRCEFIERAIPAVVDDHEGDRQRELRGTP